MFCSSGSEIEAVVLFIKQTNVESPSSFPSPQSLAFPSSHPAASALFRFGPVLPVQHVDRNSRDKAYFLESSRNMNSGAVMTITNKARVIIPLTWSAARGMASASVLMPTPSVELPQGDLDEEADAKPLKNARPRGTRLMKPDVPLDVQNPKTFPLWLGGKLINFAHFKRFEMDGSD